MAKEKKQKKERKPLSAYQKKMIKLIIGGILATVALMFSLFSAGYAANASFEYLPWVLAPACFIFGVVYVLKVIFFPNKEKVVKIYFAICIATYVALTAISFFSLMNIVMYRVFGIVFSFSIVATTIVMLFKYHKPRNFVFAVLKLAYCAILLALFLDFNTTNEEITLLFTIVPLSMGVMSFAFAMTMVFSGVRKSTISDIVRKTYSIEILYGLIVLIAATSLVLYMTEPGVSSFGDALWYCFAIVTTIGFGDITATTILGRILSVVLGIYGIIVVALITSIIVNFYNETKEENEKKELQKQIDQLKEEREAFHEEVKDIIESELEDKEDK